MGTGGRPFAVEVLHGATNEVEWIPNTAKIYTNTDVSAWCIIVGLPHWTRSSDPPQSETYVLNLLKFMQLASFRFKSYKRNHPFQELWRYARHGCQGKWALELQHSRPVDVAAEIAGSASMGVSSCFKLLQAILPQDWVKWTKQSQTRKRLWSVVLHR